MDKKKNYYEIQSRKKQSNYRNDFNQANWTTRTPCSKRCIKSLFILSYEFYSFSSLLL